MLLIRVAEPPELAESSQAAREIPICFLNFGIYIGISIYTPGERIVIDRFGVSEVVGTLARSFFVLRVTYLRLRLDLRMLIE